MQYAPTRGYNMNNLKFYLIDWKSYIGITIGCIITALSINLFLVPYNIAPGGVSGISIIIHYFFNFPVGATMLALNIPLFIFGIRQLGGAFGIKTLFGTIMLSLFTDLTNWMSFATKDILLASIFGGVTMGIGLGIVFKFGGTTGGTDLAARTIKTLLQHFTVGRIMFSIDTIIILLAIIVYRSYELGLYAVITLYISIKIIDVIIEGVEAKGAFIISDQSEIIADKILNDLRRGVTGLHGVGMYTRKDKNVLLVVVERIEIVRLKEIIKEIDENAFMILTDIREVLGEGFKSKDLK